MNVETLRFVGAIKEAQAVGFTLAEIAEHLRTARRSAAPSDALRVRMAAKIDEIDARIAALRRMREDLARVELLGVDRWIGGTHVTPACVWRWDPAELALARDERYQERRSMHACNGLVDQSSCCCNTCVYEIFGNAHDPPG